MVGLFDLGARGRSDVTSAERRGVFGDLRISRFLQRGEVESQCGWCVVLSFDPPLSLSLSLSQSWSSAFFLIFPRCWEICLLYRFSLLIGPNWVFFFFSPPWLRIDQKITFDYFYFLTNFIDVSLCADPMRRNPFFPFWRKSQHR